MKRNAGLTLIEVLIASIILAGVMAITLSLLFSSTSTAAQSSVTLDLEDRGSRLLAALREDLLSAKYTGTIALSGSLPLGIPWAPDNCSVAYRVPGNLDASGKAVTSGTVVFGHPSTLPGANAGFRQDLACVLRFEGDTVFKESSASPTATQMGNWFAPFPAFPALTTQVTNFDINRDGDKTDTFVRGKIMRYVVAPAGSPSATAKGSTLLSRETLGDHVILKVSSNPAVYNGDIEADASTAQAIDPLFRFVDENGPGGTAITLANIAANARALTVTAWFGTMDPSGRSFLLRKSAYAFKFRNTQ